MRGDNYRTMMLRWHRRRCVILSRHWRIRLRWIRIPLLAIVRRGELWVKGRLRITREGVWWGGIRIGIFVLPSTVRIYRYGGWYIVRARHHGALLPSQQERWSSRPAI